MALSLGWNMSNLWSMLPQIDSILFNHFKKRFNLIENHLLESVLNFKKLKVFFDSISHIRVLCFKSALDFISCCLYFDMHVSLWLIVNWINCFLFVCTEFIGIYTCDTRLLLCCLLILNLFLLSSLEAWYHWQRLWIVVHLFISSYF